MANATAKYPPGPPNGLLGRQHLQHLKHDLLGHLVSLRRQYGDFVSYRIGPMRIYQFSNPEQVSEILVKNAASFLKPRSVKFYFQRWMGSGLLLNEGDAWRQQRRKVRWAMQQLKPRSQANMVVSQTRDLLSQHAGSELDMAACMDRLAFYLNVRTLLGVDSDAVIESMYDAANVLHSTGIREMLAWSMAPDWLPTASKARLRQAMRVFDKVLLGLSAQRRAAAQPSDDLLGLMIVAEDRQTGQHGMIDRQARDEAVNLLMGGKETVAATLMFACYLLARHPEVQEKTAEEVRRVLRGRAPTVEDFGQLPLTQMVLKETMRLYPPVYTIARDVGQIVEIAGYRLDRGSQVHVPVFAIHRDERWFERPNEFDPQRFRPELETRRKPYTFIPFGAGPRGCAGGQMGYEQCVLVLACLLSDYRARLAPGQGEPPLATDIVLHPSEPLRMVLETRVKHDVQRLQPGENVSSPGT